MKLDFKNSLDRSELLARAESITKSRKVIIRLQREVSDCLSACQSNPEHLGNWESLMEAVKAAK